VTLDDIETPAPIVDLDRMERNLDRAAAYAAEHGLALRPHIKTHKSPLIAAEQMRRGAIGLTCATPREAEVMSEVADDILLAYPPVGAPRARRVVSVPDRTRVAVALDSATAIEHLAAAARPVGRPISVYVELDLGMHRVGVPSIEEAITLAKLVRRTPPLDYAGIAFYPGHVREPVGEQDAKLDAIDGALQETVAAMTRAGVRPTVVSGGSTPTLWRSHQLNDVTEIRPGTYVFNDRTTAEIGACAWDDCALTVLATVVSTAVPGQAVIDAGTKALGREPIRGTDAAGGFGALLDRREVTVRAMSEEHGILDLASTSWRPEVGERVQVVPNHVCIVVHLNDVVYGTRSGTVEGSWPVAARGREPAFV
jgi:D-serine deaminase-like pyridoxal phosphate-dependent protein